MNPRGKHKLDIVLGVVLVGINVFLLNLILERVRVFRLDLTEGHLYTLSDATLNILDCLEEPVGIRFYYSSREAQHDWIRPLIDPMKDILSEFKAEGGDHVRLDFVELDTAGKKAQEEAANQYGVRPFAVPVKTAFESGVKSTYFSLVIEANGAYQEKDLGSNFNEICRYVAEGAGNVGGRLELADIEYLVSKTIHQLTRTFNSVPGALVAHDERAKVRVLLSPKDVLPKDLEDLDKTIRKVTDAMTRQSDGRLTVTFESPLEGTKSVDDVARIAQPLYDEFHVRPVEKRGGGYYYASMIVFVGDAHDVVEFSGTGGPGESDVRESLEGVIKPLIPGFLPAVGLSIPPPPSMNPMMMQGRQPPSEFALLERALGRDFQVEKIDLSGDDPRIPRKVEVLVLIRPPKLSDKALFAVDQFVMRGGRLVVLADSNFLDPSRMQFGDALPVKSETNEPLAKLLACWGLKVGPGVLEDTKDCTSAVTLPVAEDIGGLRLQRLVPVSYPMALLLEDERLSRDNALTASIGQIELFWASPVEPENVPEGVQAIPLAWTGPQASTISSVPDVQTVIASRYRPPENARKYSVMVALKGELPSYFADKPVPGAAPGEEKKKEEATDGGGDGTKGDDGDGVQKKEGQAAKPRSAFEGVALKKSRPTSVVVIGDSDFLSPMVMDSISRNSDALTEHVNLLKNAIDFGGPDDAILSIRNRAPAVRSLTKLSSMTPEERKNTALLSAWLTSALSCAAVLVVALVWMLSRAGRKPLPLAAAGGSSEKGGEA